MVSSQIKLHEEYGGVVPELAAREHLKNLLPVARAALREAGISAPALDAVAATQGPGLAIALLVGFKAAQAVAFALNKPFIGINHHEAHLYSPWIGGGPPAASPRRDRPGLRLALPTSPNFSPTCRSLSAAGTHCSSSRVRVETSRPGRHH